MRDTIRRAMRDRVMASHGKTPLKKPKRVQDFGFYSDPDTAVEMYDMLRLYNVLPYEGGWMNQPEGVREDILTLMSIFDEESRAMQRKTPPSPPAPARTFDDL